MRSHLPRPRVGSQRRLTAHTRPMSQTSSEDSVRAAEAEFTAASSSKDSVRIAEAELRWADAAELWVEDLEQAGQPVSEQVRQRIARYRKDTAAG